MDFIFLAKAASGDAGVMNVDSGQLGGLLAERFPCEFDFALVARLLWTDRDIGRRYDLRVALIFTDDRDAPPEWVGELELEPPVPGGQDRYPNGLAPHLITQPVRLELAGPADYRVLVHPDDACLADLPLTVRWLRLSGPLIRFRLGLCVHRRGRWEAAAPRRVAARVHRSGGLMRRRLTEAV